MAIRARSARLLIPLLLTIVSPAAAVTIDWVSVGDPGNANDVDRPTCGFNNNQACGSVGYSYQISKYEVTNSQYVEMLTATSAADPNGLYDANMTSSARGGIIRSGVSGSFTYSVKTGFENKPVNFVTFYDATRFANWLSNGQPTGAQGVLTTEGGAYTITAPGISSNTIGRNLTALIFVPSENEWMKAGYFNTVTDAYFDYPTGTDTLTVCSNTPTATPNRANCRVGTFDVETGTDVGAYTGSPSPNGTFDQGGNVWEWTDDIKTGLNRRFRGGGFDNAASLLQSGNHVGSGFGSDSLDHLGFRVVMVPEPGTALLLMTGLAGLALRRQYRA